MNGSLYRYDLNRGEGDFFKLDVEGPMNTFDIGDDYLAVTHEQSTAQRFGFTIFNYETCQNEYIDLERVDVEEVVMDIKRLNENTLLVLTSKQLFGYDLYTGQITFQMNSDASFHIWLQ
ncbi:MAG: hypothetical protein Q4C49_08750 [Bacillota bacterium]|nr:hypothetical protein [Bacillota bacterium]